MKRILCVLFSLMMLFSTVSAHAIDEKLELTKVPLSDIVYSVCDLDSVVVLDNLDYFKTNSFDTLKKNIEQGNILVMEYQNFESIDNNLDIPFEITGLGCDGEDVLTFYYEFSDGACGVHILNCHNVTDEEKKTMVDEILTSIHSSQEEISIAKASDVSTRSTTEKYLGKIDYTSSYRPRGKLNLSYNFYTVQDYSSRDYYIVKGSINGMPGCILSEDDSNYESKYQGKAMTALIETTSDSVTVDSYGPHRTVDTSSYSVNVSGTFQKGVSPSFSGGFNYTRNLVDTDIEASATTRYAEWEIDFDGNAQENSFNFEPAVTFDCPSSKSYVDFSLSATYDVDAWNTFNHTISSSISVRCDALNVN